MGTKDTLWLFHHIPKTAGSSLRAELVNATRSQYNIYEGAVIPDDPALRTPIILLNLACDDFFIKHAERPRRFVSGHLLRTHVERILSLGNVKMFTLLREPFDRLVSSYRYQQTPTHPQHNEFIARFPDFSNFIEFEHSANAMAKYITGDEEPSAEKCIEILRRDYVFVGTIERYSICRLMLFELINAEAPEEETRERESAPTVPNEIDDKERYRELFRERNRVDYEVYDFVRNRIESQVESMKCAIHTLGMASV
nr:sulfotransferase family 2 domain-containing protein [Propylenella binzhouense]